MEAASAYLNQTRRVCACGVAPSQPIVCRKPGKNQGRSFITCRLGNCDFFRFTDTLTQPAQVIDLGGMFSLQF